ncbi:MAG TPA: PadR family transcriptional regulator [Spirochaetota bacterium]|nr:PadR family transcriptional regulator [Spirochaetota bacterium]HPJ34126.1 PadR family transcriptional regulator [Spirochaetota bacterium]
MATKHMLLGALMSGPAHGYSLRSDFFAKILEEFGINDGQLYPLLKKMTDEGLIRKEIEYRESGPNRHNYHITEKGREEFLSWLTGNEGEERAFRYEMIRKDEFLNKSMYFKLLEKGTALEKIGEHIKEAESILEDFNKAYKDMSERKMDPLNLLVLRYCVMNQETRINWLKELNTFFKNKK